MAEHLAAIAALEEQPRGVIDLGPHRARCRADQPARPDRPAGRPLVSLLPEGPPLYPDGEITDEPTETLVAELIREAALEGVRDELPHSITVAVEEMGLREGRPDQAAVGRLRLDDRRARLAEGHRHRPPRLPAARDRRGRPRARSRPCSARRSIWISGSRCSRSGSATPSTSTGSASEPPRSSPSRTRRALGAAAVVALREESALRSSLLRSAPSAPPMLDRGLAGDPTRARTSGGAGSWSRTGRSSGLRSQARPTTDQAEPVTVNGRVAAALGSARAAPPAGPRRALGCSPRRVRRPG